MIRSHVESRQSCHPERLNWTQRRDRPWYWGSWTQLTIVMKEWMNSDTWENLFIKRACPRRRIGWPRTWRASNTIQTWLIIPYCPKMKKWNRLLKIILTNIFYNTPHRLAARKRRTWILHFHLRNFCQCKTTKSFSTTTCPSWQSYPRSETIYNKSYNNTFMAAEKWMMIHQVTRLISTL